ncbi:NAD-dependent epimerase/dehydratase family protein [Methanococcus maripaludis]|uniref:UDP-glucose 4-epimerase n=1 Tax=Methanococcus maripaludis TaxID=39152 RepID=A0A2L1CDG6_METMI|nr:NAD-dependent epimerase/dehydratase family protein [Methanococcus maripaludis]AVB77126.1 UDP-glucose 4-epimerase [Methanococcus maripaludis]MBA2863638.1 UDP-glucose 4-epimerase [Methanococcus maripaludis]MBB6496356.1 UDP-glucose 4-epimerase [Methanococcus maripaludis]
MKILVTGGAGFIGSHIVDILIENGHDVSILDNLSTGNEKNLNSKAKFIKGDILDKNLDLTGFDCVIHEAAQINVRTSIEDPVFDANINILGTVNILEKMKENGVKKIIFSSSVATVGEPEYLPVDENHTLKPLSPYGLSKVCAEEYIKLYNKFYGTEYCILRYANVYGERQDPLGEAGVISIFIDKMKKGEQPVIYGDGNQTRDFVNVKDVARANLMALNWKNETVNICSGKEISINELFKIISSEHGFDLNPIYEEGMDGEIYQIYMENDNAKSLGWVPEVELENGIKEI